MEQKYHLTLRPPFAAPMQMQRPQSLRVCPQLQQPFPIIANPVNTSPFFHPQLPFPTTTTRQQQQGDHQPHQQQFNKSFKLPNNGASHSQPLNCTNRNSPRSNQQSPSHSSLHLHSPEKQKAANKTEVSNSTHIWCGKGTIEPVVTRHVYNYAQRKDTMEKTPMCRVAEMARYNKLKHCYVLLDESGPAHKKKFSVKLVLCPGQEFEGHGPSIKKAQQSAAQKALETSTLQKPPQMRGVRRPLPKRDDPNSPIALLNSVVAQLGISIQYREESIRKAVDITQSLINKSNNATLASPPVFSPGLPPPSMASTLCCPSMLLPPPTAINQFTKYNNNTQPFVAPQLSPGKPIASILDMSTMGNSSSAAANGYLALLSPIQLQMMTTAENSSNAVPATFPPFCHPYLAVQNTTPLYASQSTNGRPGLLGPHPMHEFSYKVTILFRRDGTEHVGLSPSLATAKQKAATLALAHLRPELERFKREREGNESDQQQKPEDKKDEKSGKAQRQKGEEIGANGKQQPQCWSINSSRSSSRHDESSESEEKEAEGIEQYEEGKVEGNLDSGVACSAPKEQQRTRKKTKSVVSQIHECALRLRMNVEFEVLAESGEPHQRVYTLRCRLSAPQSTLMRERKERQFVSEGQGLSKRAAKQAACQKLLGQVQHLLANDPIQLASSIVRSSGMNSVARRDTTAHGAEGKGNKGEEKELQGGKRRTIIKDKKMDPEYGHHINPISRLQGVMQTRGERDPFYRLVGEQGQNRYKEFTVAVHCGDMEEQGTGPNKKLAKRAAAEAMLSRIGYVKPMPLPGKSLLKKPTAVAPDVVTENGNNMLSRDNSSSGDGSPLKMAEIGVFDAANCETGVDGGEWTAPTEWAEEPREQRKSATAAQHQLETFADVEQSFSSDGRAMDSWMSPLEEEEPMRQHRQQQHQQSPLLGSDSNSLSSPDNVLLTSPSPEANDQQPIRSNRRRVTFSEHVSACPPPEDSSYPASSIAPLKSEDLGPLGGGGSGRPKRRSKDSQRVLGAEETARLAEAAQLFMSWPKAELEKRGYAEAEWATDRESGKETTTPALLAGTLRELYLGKEMDTVNDGALNNGHRQMLGPPPPSVPPLLPIAPLLATQLTPPPFLPTIPPPPVDQMKLSLVEAKQFLECLAKCYKFTVAYSDFPKTKNAANEEQCFSLVTLGLAKPIVCHGSGRTEANAHSDAALNAIRKCGELAGD